MKKFICTCIIFLMSFNAFPNNVDVDHLNVIQGMELMANDDLRIFETSDKIIHFSSIRVLHLSDGSLYVCPHNAVVENTIAGRMCLSEDLKNAWLPLVVLPVEGFEIVGVRFTFTAKGDGGLLVYFRKK